MSNYNKYYLEPDYFGEPYPELIDYIKRFKSDAVILDLGCGQGRDTLALGRLGYTVDGIDISDVGIAQLNEVAREESLKVTGIVMNYQDFNGVHNYDIVIMNSMFHFYKNDLVKETKDLRNIIDRLKKNAILVLVIQESKFRKRHIKEIVDGFGSNLEIDYETSLIYKEFNGLFYMIAIRKR